VSGLVLLVGDDRDMRVLAQRWLVESGYVVHALETGEDCLAALGHSLPDAILLDADLAGPSGIDVLEAIRDLQHFLPVILTTTESAVDTVTRAMRLGAYDYLVKPLDRTKLLTTAKNAVERHRMTVRLARFENGADGSSLVAPHGPLMRLDELERLAIENALRHTNGNLSAVVRHLGIGRTTLYRKLKKYGLQ